MPGSCQRGSPLAAPPVPSIWPPRSSRCPGDRGLSSEKPGCPLPCGLERWITMLLFASFLQGEGILRQPRIAASPSARAPEACVVLSGPCSSEILPFSLWKGAGKLLWRIWLKECLRSGTQMLFVTFNYCVLWCVSTEVVFVTLARSPPLRSPRARGKIHKTFNLHKSFMSNIYFWGAWLPV